MDINRIIIYIMLFFVLVGGFSALVIALFLSRPHEESQK